MVVGLKGDEQEAPTGIAGRSVRLMKDINCDIMPLILPGLALCCVNAFQHHRMAQLKAVLLCSIRERSLTETQALLHPLHFGDERCVAIYSTSSSRFQLTTGIGLVFLRERAHK